jgi:lysophospholipase
MTVSSFKQQVDALCVDQLIEPLTVSDRVTLRVGRWTPQPTRGRVLLLSGRGGFLEKYYPVLIQLLQRGLEVVSFDWRGQGLSSRLSADPHLGYVDNFSDYIDDLDRVWSAVLRPESGHRNYLLAHSMGAHIALRWLRERQAGAALFAHAWLTAPLAGIDTRPYPVPLAKLIAAIACRVGARHRYVPQGFGFDAENYQLQGLATLTSDREQIAYELACIQANPELQLGAASFGWLNAAFQSLKRLQSPGYIEQIAQPIALFLAEDEQVVDNQALHIMQRRLRHSTLVTIPAAKHDLLVEDERLQAPVWAAIDCQLADHLKI